MCSALIFRLSEEEDDVYREWKRGESVNNEQEGMFG